MRRPSTRAVGAAVALLVCCAPWIGGEHAPPRDPAPKRRRAKDSRDA